MPLLPVLRIRPPVSQRRGNEYNQHDRFTGFFESAALMARV